MRIWSLHPKYLDKKGLLALWRETFLAKKVLEGKTKGYKNHPQLYRFKKAADPLDCINQYLVAVYQESVKRGYKFERSKIEPDFTATKLTVTSGQLNFERDHLLRKLKIRDPKKYKDLITETRLEPHPLFRVIEGNIEEWEIIRDKKAVLG
jgi:hypothetical protein